MRVGVCYARIIVARFFGGGGCPLWARFSPPFWVGFSACFGGILWGLFWGGVVGERERQRRTGKGERAQGRTAHGLRVSACLPLVSVSAVFVRPSILSF